METSQILAIILTLLTITIAFIFYLQNRKLKYREYSIRDRYYDLRNKEGDLEMKKWEQEREVQEKISEKSRKFIRIPSVSFHYADKERIKNMYNEYFKEPTITNVVSEKISKTDGKIKGNFPQILSAEIGASDLTKWISEIKLPDTSVSGMFKRYQRETVKREQVNLSLEIIEADLFIVDEFDRKIKEFEEKYSFSIEKTTVKKQREKLHEVAIEKTIKKLETASDWVLIEGSFLIETEGEKFYKLSMVHPVSSFIQGDIQITITCLIKKESIEPSFSGNYLKSIGTSIPINIYGQIWQPINLSKNIYELSITPLAIY